MGRGTTPTLSPAQLHWLTLPDQDGKPDLAAYHSFRTALIVPVGINYERKDGWRSRVVVEYGEVRQTRHEHTMVRANLCLVKPIEVDQYLAEFINGDAKTTTKKLTEKLYVSLRCLTVNAPDWDTLDLIHLSQRIIVPKHVDASLTLKTKLLQKYINPITWFTIYLKEQKYYRKYVAFQRRTRGPQRIPKCSSCAKT